MDPMHMQGQVALMANNPNMQQNMAPPFNPEELTKGLINTPEESARRRDQDLGLSGNPADDWLCKCGFKNMSRNNICGGMGNMGCKVERALCQVAGAMVNATVMHNPVKVG